MEIVETKVIPDEEVGLLQRNVEVMSLLFQPNSSISNGSMAIIQQLSIPTLNTNTFRLRLRGGEFVKITASVLSQV